MEDQEIRRILSPRDAYNRANFKDLMVAAVDTKRCVKRLGLQELLRTQTCIISSTPDPSELADIGVPILNVKNLRNALRDIAYQAIQKYTGDIIVITGSAGKTSTVELIKHTLGTYHTIYTGRRNANTLPALYRQLTDIDNEEYAILEVSRIALPRVTEILTARVAVLTSIAEAHLEEIGSLKDVALRKASIFQTLSGGTAVVNIDTPYGKLAAEIAEANAGRVMTYGEKSPSAQIRLVDYERQAGTVAAEVAGNPVRYEIRMSGEYSAVNSLAVLGVLTALNLDVGEYANALKGATDLRGRGDTHRLRLYDRNVTIVDQSFNANPLSMRTALAHFKALPHSGRKVLVLGEMLELGADSSQYHIDLGEPVRAVNAELICLVGEGMRDLYTTLNGTGHIIHYDAIEEFEVEVPGLLTENDMILLKGSRYSGILKLASKWVAGLGDEIAVNVFITGSGIRGRAFHRWIKAACDARNVVGWVRNYSNSSVEARLQGKREDIGMIVLEFLSGPRDSEVTNINVKPLEVKKRAGFRMKKTATGSR